MNLTVLLFWEHIPVSEPITCQIFLAQHNFLDNCSAEGRCKSIGRSLLVNLGGSAVATFFLYMRKKVCMQYFALIDHFVRAIQFAFFDFGIGKLQLLK